MAQTVFFFAALWCMMHGKLRMGPSESASALMMGTARFDWASEYIFTAWHTIYYIYIHRIPPTHTYRYVKRILVKPKKEAARALAAAGVGADAVGGAVRRLGAVIAA